MGFAMFNTQFAVPAEIKTFFVLLILESCCFLKIAGDTVQIDCTTVHAGIFVETVEKISD